MFNWSDRPTKIDVRHRIGGENPARVFTVGRYQVTVPDDPEGDPTYTTPSNLNDYHAKASFPNMEVVDGQMRIPLDDIVDAILSRVEPVEVAVALWANNDVREEFVSAMVHRYSQCNVNDADRRKVLHGLQEAVHSKALDTLANTMAKLEYEIAKGYSLWREVETVNQTLTAYGATRPPREGEDGPQPLRIQDRTNVGEFRIGGSAWNEARDHWRGEVLRQFPAPEPINEPADADAFE